jgi:RNAse (barnase) inhibitor barstar
MFVADLNQSLYIDGSKCMTKEDMFEAFSDVLDFPDYFSNTWDSFEEIVNDLDLGNKNIIVLNAELILQEDEESFEILSDILHQANGEQTYTFHYLAAY